MGCGQWWCRTCFILAPILCSPIHPSMPSSQVIHIEPLAPPKPALGAACNGCGVCCLAEPCPVGVLLSGRSTGACRALRWQPAAARYTCGAITAPTEVVLVALPHRLAWLARPLASLLRWCAPRWIAAGTGCDSTLETSRTSSTPVWARTVSCICAIIDSISAALALPKLMMKFACLMDTCAPPMVKPLSPHDSISRAA